MEKLFGDEFGSVKVDDVSLVDLLNGVEEGIALVFIDDSITTVADADMLA
jgi:hypothetical protein